MMPNFLFTFASDFLFFFIPFWIFSSQKLSPEPWIVDLFIKIQICSLCTLPLLLYSWSILSLFSPLPKGSPDGPSLYSHRPASEAVVGSKRDKREMGQYTVNPGLLCLIGSVGLCVRGNIYSIGPFHNNTQFPANGQFYVT